MAVKLLLPYLDKELSDLTQHIASKLGRDLDKMLILEEAHNWELKIVGKGFEIS